MVFYLLVVCFLSVFCKLKNTFLLPGLLWGDFLRLINPSKTAIKGRGTQYRDYDLYKRKSYSPELLILNDIMRVVSLVDVALTRNLSVKTITSHKINALKKLGVKSMSDLLVRR